MTHRKGTYHDGRNTEALDAEQLYEEVIGLRRAMESRAIIDRACGILMVTCRCRADDSWEILAEISQQTNIKVRVLAGHIVESVGDEGGLPRSLRTALLAAVERRSGTARSDRGFSGL